jgi:hypothetical protein
MQQINDLDVFQKLLHDDIWPKVSESVGLERV